MLCSMTPQLLKKKKRKFEGAYLIRYSRYGDSIEKKFWKNYNKTIFYISYSSGYKGNYLVSI